MGIRDVTVGDLLTRCGGRCRRTGARLRTGPRYTFSELDGGPHDRARLDGARRGARVSAWSSGRRNVPEWVVLQFALAKIGAILVTANTALRARDIDYLLRQSEAATLITIRGVRDMDYVGALDEIGATRGAHSGPEARSSSSATTIHRRCRGFVALRARCGSRRDVDAGVGARRARRAVGIDDVINMQYTSGTTGFPKGVMLSSRNIVNNGHALAAALGYTPADRLCLCVPLFHCFGCVIGVLGAYTHGACLCPLEAFDPRRVLATVERERCTALYGVPTMFLAELEHPEFSRFDLHVAADRRHGGVALPGAARCAA